MKKLPVLIVLLVFGISFVGASSAFGEPKEVSKIEYYLEDPGDTEDYCYVEVYISPKFKLNIVDGNCKLQDPATPVKIENLTINGQSVDVWQGLQGWYYYHKSPGRYCYVHPVTKQYICIYW